MARHDDAKPIVGFAKDAASKSGFSLSTIKDCAKIGGGLSDDSIARIKGTWLALRQGELLLLSACDLETQEKILDLLLREKEPVKSVSKAKSHLLGNPASNVDAKANARRKLDQAWEKAPENVQADFLQMLADMGIVLPDAKREVV
jgi:hypothetical protein